MSPAFHLILLIASFLSGCLTVYISGPGLTWQRAFSFAFTLLVASMISW